MRAPASPDSINTRPGARIQCRLPSIQEPTIQQLDQTDNHLPHLKELIRDANRQMVICAECRYCDGFCAVFPPVARRLDDSHAQTHYLANLCHNCGACLRVCQYAPPHELAVNVPQAMARVRVQTYAAYAWPASLGALYQRAGLTVSLSAAIGLALFLALAALMQAPISGAPQMGVYSIFSHSLLTALFIPIFLFAVIALGRGVHRFWRDSGPNIADQTAASYKTCLSRHVALTAASDALRLTYLHDGNAGTPWRRHFHHATFYGFLLCFAATGVATVYHYVFGWPAPYTLPSIPKLLGVAGGISLLTGTIGLFVLNTKRHPAHGEITQKPMDQGFMALLLAISLSGLTLWLFNRSSAMTSLLVIHLGSVMALFLTMPYGKFAHGIFRGAALLMWALERRRISFTHRKEGATHQKTHIN